MTLEHIIAGLEARLAAELETIEQQTQAQIEAVEAAAAEQVLAVHQQQLEAVQVRIRAVRTRQINQARLEAQQICLEARNRLVDAVFDATREALTRLRQQPEYPNILAQLVEETVAELGAPLCLALDRRDTSVVTALVQDLNGEIEVEPTLTTWGGVIGRSPDGRIVVENTLEGRFAQAQQRFGGDVADLIQRAMNRDR